MNDEEQTSYCQKGVLEAAVSFGNILKENNDKFNTKQLLALMVHLRLAIPFTDKNGIQKYFIPSILNHVPIQLVRRERQILLLCVFLFS